MAGRYTTRPLNVATAAITFAITEAAMISFRFNVSSIAANGIVQLVVYRTTGAIPAFNETVPPATPGSLFWSGARMSAANANLCDSYVFYDTLLDPTLAYRYYLAAWVAGWGTLSDPGTIWPGTILQVTER